MLPILFLATCVECNLVRRWVDKKFLFASKPTFFRRSVKKMWLPASDQPLLKLTHFTVLIVPWKLNEDRFPCTKLAAENIERALFSSSVLFRVSAELFTTDRTNRFWQKSRITTPKKGSKYWILCWYYDIYFIEQNFCFYLASPFSRFWLLPITVYRCWDYTYLQLPFECRKAQQGLRPLVFKIIIAFLF